MEREEALTGDTFNEMPVPSLKMARSLSEPAIGSPVTAKMTARASLATAKVLEAPTGELTPKQQRQRRRSSLEEKQRGTRSSPPHIRELYALEVLCKKAAAEYVEDTTPVAMFRQPTPPKKLGGEDLSPRKTSFDRIATMPLPKGLPLDYRDAGNATGAAAPPFPPFAALTGCTAKTATAPPSPTPPTPSAPRSPSPSTTRRRKPRVSVSLPRRLALPLPLPRPLSWFRCQTLDVVEPADAPGWQPSGLASILTAQAGLPPTIKIGCI